MNEITLITPPHGVTAADYAAIEEAVMETARGRWFLLEYARRQRAAETQRLADAVDRLENAIASMAPQAEAAAPVPALAPAPAEPQDETAAAVAEKLSDIVWTMRERGVGDQFCVELEKQIRIIRSFRVGLQTTPRIEAPASESADNAALELTHDLPTVVAETAQSSPALGERNVERDEAPAPLELPPPWRPTAPPPAAVDARVAALSRLDALPLSEKIALFC